MPSDVSPNLSLPYIAGSQAQKHITHNEALRALDAVVQLAILDRDIGAPPASPLNGARYIVGSSPTGGWAGQAGKIAVYQDAAWEFYAPVEGWLAWVADEDLMLIWNGTNWLNALNPAAGKMIGINASADATNRLTVKSDAVLFSHDDATPGNGDIRTVLNKMTPVKTASLTFQTNYSGRSEMGLTGDDNFHFKVSSDGTNWTEALMFSGDGKAALKGATIAGALSVKLSGSFSAGAIWSDGVATFGTGNGVSSGALGIAYDDTSGSRLISAYPGVGWKNFSVFSNLIKLHANGNVLIVELDVNRASFSKPAKMPAFTVALLPSGLSGDLVWCTNGRMFNGTGTLEAPGAGTGGLVSHNGTAWKIAGTNVTVSA